MRVELLAGDAGLDAAVEVVGADLRTRFIPPRSTDTPPANAATWPSSEVPTPNAITGNRCPAQMATMALTSSVVRGNATASGGWAGW